MTHHEHSATILQFAPNTPRHRPRSSDPRPEKPPGGRTLYGAFVLLQVTLLGLAVWGGAILLGTPWPMVGLGLMAVSVLLMGMSFVAAVIECSKKE